MVLIRMHRFSIRTLCLLAWIGPALGNAAGAPQRAFPNCVAGELAGQGGPALAGRYPRHAAGWGPEAGNGIFISRWAEHWASQCAAGYAPPFKAIRLGGASSLTLSAEARLRYDAYDNRQLASENDERQVLFRGVLGAHLRLDPHLRLFGEVGTGQVTSERARAMPNFQNKAALQQLFVDYRIGTGAAVLGAMVGRQEYADGPRQLMSLSDGPNLHRTWNGTRLYAHGPNARVGAFVLRATRPGRGAFDEQINRGERLTGVNGSVVLSPGQKDNTYLDPFWLRSTSQTGRVGGASGLERRDTVGARLWGRRGKLRFDWTLAHQSGHFMDRKVDAWGVFAVHSLVLSDENWKPRLTTHIDIASGGGAYGTGTVRDFNHLYASSNYLGEGQFLSLSNLLMIAPGIALSPTSKTNLSFEYGFARRLSEDDAAYAGAMRPYAGTRNVPGQAIGTLVRAVGTWSASENVTVFFNIERLLADDVLKRAGFASGSYATMGATFRY